MRNIMIKIKFVVLSIFFSTVSTFFFTVNVGAVTLTPKYLDTLSYPNKPELNTSNFPYSKIKSLDFLLLEKEGKEHFIFKLNPLTSLPLVKPPYKLPSYILKSDNDIIEKKDSDTIVVSDTLFIVALPDTVNKTASYLRTRELKIPSNKQFGVRAGFKHSYLIGQDDDKIAINRLLFGASYEINNIFIPQNRFDNLSDYFGVEAIFTGEGSGEGALNMVNIKNSLGIRASWSLKLSITENLKKLITFRLPILSAQFSFPIDFLNKNSSPGQNCSGLTAGIGGGIELNSSGLNWVLDGRYNFVEPAIDYQRGKLDHKSWEIGLSLYLPVSAQKVIKTEYYEFEEKLPPANINTSGLVQIDGKSVDRSIIYIIYNKCYTMDEAMYMLDKYQYVNVEMLCSLKSIYFATGKYNEGHNQRDINSIRNFLEELVYKQGGNYEIITNGYASQRPFSDNYGLSLRRAEFVSSELQRNISHNISGLSFYSRGEGIAKYTDENHDLYEKVDIKINLISGNAFFNNDRRGGCISIDQALSLSHRRNRGFIDRAICPVCMKSLDNDILDDIVEIIKQNEGRNTKITVTGYANERGLRSAETMVNNVEEFLIKSGVNVSISKEIYIGTNIKTNQVVVSFE